jgi:hypothetical protein
MKALEKDGSRRYETANGLGMDVQRYLQNESVQACRSAARLRRQDRHRRTAQPLPGAGGRTRAGGRFRDLCGFALLDNASLCPTRAAVARGSSRVTRLDFNALASDGLMTKRVFDLVN